MEMELSFREQMRCLLESGGLGLLLGLVYDVFRLSGETSRRRLFWGECLFGPVAAVLTLFGSLVILDGRMHPLLFIGIAVGAVAENRTVGRLVSPLIRLKTRARQRGKQAFFRLWTCFWEKKREKTQKNPEKS